MQKSWIRALTFSSATLVLGAWSLGGCGGDDDSTGAGTGGSKAGKGGTAGKSTGGSSGKSTGGSAGKGGTGGSAGKGGTGGGSNGGKGGTGGMSGGGQAGEAGGGATGASGGTSGRGGTSGKGGTGGNGGAGAAGEAGTGAGGQGAADGGPQETPCEKLCDGALGLVAVCSQDDLPNDGDGGFRPVYTSESECRTDCGNLLPPTVDCRQGHVDQINGGAMKSMECPLAYGLGGCT